MHTFHLGDLLLLKQAREFMTDKVDVDEPVELHSISDLSTQGGPRYSGLLRKHQGQGYWCFRVDLETDVTLFACPHKP